MNLGDERRLNLDGLAGALLERSVDATELFDGESRLVDGVVLRQRTQEGGLHVDRGRLELALDGLALALDVGHLAHELTQLIGGRRAALVGGGARRQRHGRLQFVFGAAEQVDAAPVRLELALDDGVGAGGVGQDLPVLGQVVAEALRQFRGRRALPALAELAAQLLVRLLLLVEQAIGLVEDLAVALQQGRQLVDEAGHVAQAAGLAHVAGLVAQRLRQRRTARLLQSRRQV